jgi:hypothetical protein
MKKKYTCFPCKFFKEFFLLLIHSMKKLTTHKEDIYVDKTVDVTVVRTKRLNFAKKIRFI